MALAIRKEERHCMACGGTGKVEKYDEKLSKKAGKVLFVEVRCASCSGTGKQGLVTK